MILFPWQVVSPKEENKATGNLSLGLSPHGLTFTCHSDFSLASPVPEFKGAAGLGAHSKPSLPHLNHFCPLIPLWMDLDW